MPISPYLAALRARAGPALLLLPGVTGIIFDDAGRLLLVRQRPDGLWSTPGGSLEPDETPADGVVREIREETGLKTVPVRLLGVVGGPAFDVTYPNGDRVQYMSAVFECAVQSGTPSADGNEVSELAWFDAAGADAVVQQPWLRAILPRLFTRSTDAFF